MDKKGSSIIDLHNKIRQNPKSFIPVIEKYMAYFSDQTHKNLLRVPDREPVMTNEGPKAVSGFDLVQRSNRILEETTCSKDKS